MSQIGTLEALIGRKSAILRRLLIRARCIPITSLATSLFSLEFMEKHEIKVLACQVGPFHLTFTQISSEMNCIAKNKCPDSQKLRHEADDTRRRGENFNASQEQPNDMYMFAFFLFDLFYVMQEKIPKILTKSYSVE